MPDIPMPPIPMKWMGPSLSGNLMNCFLVRHQTKHQISKPFGRIGDARLLRRSSAARKTSHISLRFNKRSRQPLRRKYALLGNNRSAGRGELFRIGRLVLVYRARKRHKDGRATDDGKL